MHVILYSKTGCPWGTQVKDYLESKGIPYEEREMLGNPEFRDECIAKSGQWKCPTLDIDGHILADSDAEALEKYLNTISKL